MTRSGEVARGQLRHLRIRHQSTLKDAPGVATVPARMTRQDGDDRAVRVGACAHHLTPDVSGDVACGATPAQGGWVLEQQPTGVRRHRGHELERHDGTERMADDQRLADRVLRHHVFGQSRH